ncbi:hypothetical protein [Kribbella shirazensis]|uniref:Uncharacterized protein n=1 Tax=Kribbella shirazensis TaxID=1105143 RepID=A0A7X5V4H7_9ACTN|nr:hypothetical protein [Kribbella shirazensis]NIK54299.1 hypothetical protein [Kribbella shirazensis]
MTQPNADAGQGQQPPIAGAHGHYPAGPIAPGQQHPYGAQQNHFQPGIPVTPPRKRRGSTAVAAGVILLAVALVVLVLPFGLFILGGGGDTEKFGEMQNRFMIASAAFALLGLAVLTFGVAAAVASRRHRS